MVGLYVDGHRGVEGGNAEVLLYVAVEYGDVAVSYNPFGVLGKVGEVEVVDDADGSVTAADTEYGFDFGVVEQLLHQGGADVVGAGELVVGVIEVVGHDGLKPP